MHTTLDGSCSPTGSRTARSYTIADGVFIKFYFHYFNYFNVKSAGYNVTRYGGCRIEREGEKYSLKKEIISGILSCLRGFSKRFFRTSRRSKETVVGRGERREFIIHVLKYERNRVPLSCSIMK